MRQFLFLIILTCALQRVTAQTYTLASPDKKFLISVDVKDSVRYSVKYVGTAVLQPSTIAMKLDKTTLGKQAKVVSTNRVSINKILRPIYGKAATLAERYNQLSIKFSGDYTIVFRAYNEGVAYRFETAMKDSIKVISEQANFNLVGSPAAILPETNNYTAWEVPYVEHPSISEIKADTRSLTPALFSYPDNNIKVVLAEADQYDYPGMYVQKQGCHFAGNWAQYPAKTEMGSWGNFVSVVKERENYIVKTPGTRSFPWRVIIATNDDRTLLNNQLIWMLSRPSTFKNTGWIKPGKATWEWWHDAMLPGADIPSGMPNRNTVLYKYYVDFAAKNKLEYLMVDAGWSDNYDVKKMLPRVDMPELIRYAKSKNVGVFLWAVAVPLLKDLNKNLDFIKSLGAVGIKVDFFDRDDQQAMQWMEQIAKAAAERQLMVNFHGCSKPSGMQRAYPNIVNYEAVRGEECSKWDYTANPKHHLTFPFARMLAGPLDYTPGSMRNATREVFKPVDPGLPSSLGTRCHELAMYVVFDQPFAMLSDSPKEYEKYPDIMNYLSAVPTIFDETRVLSAKLGCYAVIAKRKGNNSYIGAMTDWEEREIIVDLSFLPKGETYKAEIYTDGADANTNATSYHHVTQWGVRATKLKLKLAKGGGAVVYLHQ